VIYPDRIYLHLYNLLLRLYPASFRNEYGDELRAIFRQRLSARTGPIAGLEVWLSAIGETAANAALVHGDVLAQDLRYAGRTVKRAPGFALTAVLIIALGIGATTAAFTVTDFVLLRPLPFPAPDRLVKIWEKTLGYSAMELSAPNYRDWTAAARSFESTGVYHDESIIMMSGGEARRVLGAAISADLLPTLGVAPFIGRGFTAADDAAGAAGTVLLSYPLWQTEFGGDAGILGQSVTFDREAFTVVGVMPPEFHFPRSDRLFWIPARFGERDYQPSERTNNYLYAVGRLRRGVTIERARAEMDLIAAQSRQQYPKENKDTGAVLQRLADEVPDRSRLLLIALSAAASCVLLIACANLANLLLARALGRRRELAVRAAIGAGRERMVRQLMTESLLLAGVGGALGIGLAVAFVPLLSQLVPVTLPIAASPSIDVRVLLFAVGLTAATGIGFGLAPILRVGAAPDLDGLREGVRSGSGRSEGLRSVLVVAEIVASVVLLVCAGLLIRALLTVHGIDPGFKADGVLAMRTELRTPEYGPVAAREAFYGRVLSGVRALPGVEAAGFVSFLPMSTFRGGIWPVSVKGDVETESGTTRSRNNVAAIRFVTPGFFEAMGIALRRGRDIGEGDGRSRQFVAVVSESFVRRYWPGQDPIGRHFTFAYADREVVGVVADVRFRGLERESEPQVYLSSQQVADGAIFFYAARTLAVRTVGAPAQLATSVRAIVRQADPNVAVPEVLAVTELIDRETASRAVQVRVLSAFALIAFVLAAVGIHGLLSFAVSQRTQEIGVRMALGAQTADVLALVTGRSALLAAAGIVPGVALAYAAGRSMEALLAGVRPFDLPTVLAAVVIAAVMTLAGSIVPAIRAVRVDPICALRAE
jgi:putative ABC transport system permease protein